MPLAFRSRRTLVANTSRKSMRERKPTARYTAPRYIEQSAWTRDYSAKEEGGMISDSGLRFFALTAAFLLWAFPSARAAEVRCQSGIHGHYKLPQDEGWFMRRWPSGVR